MAEELQRHRDMDRNVVHRPTTPLADRARAVDSMRRRALEQRALHEAHWRSRSENEQGNAVPAPGVPVPRFRVEDEWVPMEVRKRSRCSCGGCSCAATDLIVEIDVRRKNIMTLFRSMFPVLLIESGMCPAPQGPDLPDTQHRFFTSD